MVIQRDIIKRLENQNYAEKKKTWDIIGALLGLAILIVGVIFAIVPPESYRANSVDRISFGADYYTEDAASAAEVAKEAVLKRKAS